MGEHCHAAGQPWHGTLAGCPATYRPRVESTYQVRMILPGGGVRVEERHSVTPARFEVRSAEASWSAWSASLTWDEPEPDAPPRWYSST